MAIKKIVVTTDETGPLREEFYCDAIITPGQLCEITATGAKRHATSGGAAQKLIAIEDDLQGNGIDDNYVALEQGQFAHMRAGDKAYMLLSNGENASIGSFLESNGDGDLAVSDIGTSGADNLDTSIVAVARAALDMSGSSGVDPASRRILVQFV